MKKANNSQKQSEMRSEYDFRGGIRGRYTKQYAKGTNLVLLAPDIAEVFPDAAAVNGALRLLLKAAQKSTSTVKVKQRT